MYPLVVIDFETTGLSPDMGDRATEVAAVIVQDGQIAGHYQSLMNAGVRIPPFVQDLTGITNAMIRSAPPAAQVMSDLTDFIGDLPLVAHNASFDSKFLYAELARINRAQSHQFVCSMLLARRIYPDASDHKLGSLVRYLGLPSAQRHHRALADAEMTAHLWLKMCADLQTQYALPSISYEFCCKLQKAAKTRVAECVAREKLRLATRN